MTCIESLIDIDSYIQIHIVGYIEVFSTLTTFSRNATTKPLCWEHLTTKTRHHT